LLAVIENRRKQRKRGQKQWIWVKTGEYGVKWQAGRAEKVRTKYVSGQKVERGRKGLKWVKNVARGEKKTRKKQRNFDTYGRQKKLKKEVCGDSPWVSSTQFPGRICPKWAEKWRFWYADSENHKIISLRDH
jgi:hypothetical protein